MRQGPLSGGARLVTVMLAAGLSAALASCGTAASIAAPTSAGPQPTAMATTATTPSATVPATGTPGLAASVRSAGVPAGRWAIGDSVMLGSRPLLTAAGVRVDAVVGRQFGQGIYRLRAVRRAGHLPRNVVVHLGTNGTITVKDCTAIVSAAGPTRRVFLLTVLAPRSWIALDNKHVRSCAAAFPAGRVVVVDWNRAAAHHPEWFGPDRIHPNSVGRRAYTALIVAALRTRGL